MCNFFIFLFGKGIVIILDGFIVNLLLLMVIFLLIFLIKFFNNCMFEILGRFLIVIGDLVKIVVGISVMVLFLVLLMWMDLFKVKLFCIFNFFIYSFFLVKESFLFSNWGKFWYKEYLKEWLFFLLFISVYENEKIMYSFDKIKEKYGIYLLGW